MTGEAPERLVYARDHDGYLFPSYDINKFGLVAAKTGTTYLTVYDTGGAILGQVNYNPQGRQDSSVSRRKVSIASAGFSTRMSMSMVVAPIRPILRWKRSFR